MSAIISQELTELIKAKGFEKDKHRQTTIYDVQTWLRNEYNIHIELQYSFKEDESGIEWWFYIYPEIGKGGRIKYFSQEIGENLSYEDALHIGLEEALKLI